MIRVAVGGTFGTGGYSLRMYDGDGTLLWSKATSNDVRGVAFDSAGNLHVAASNDLKKYSLGGTEITADDWPVTTLDTSYAIAVASDSKFAVARNRSSSPYRPAHKYATDATTDWTDDHGADFYAVACDGTNAIFGGVRSSSTTTRKYDASGSRTWSKDHGATVFGVAVDGSGNVAAGGIRTSSITTRVYDSGGTAQWTKDHGATVMSCAWDGSGNLITGGFQSSSITTRLYNSSGTEQWTADHGATVRGVAADSDGNVYTVGDDASGVTFRKYDSGGTEVTAGDWPLDHGATLYCVACYTITDAITAVPALAVGLALAVPAAQVHAFQIPALAISLALAVPTATLPPAVPALVLSSAAEKMVFRVYLTGGTSLIEWPVARIEVAMESGAETRLSVACPVSRVDVAAAPALAEVVIYAGSCDESGTETLGEWHRGTIETIGYSRTPSASMATIIARAAPASSTPVLRSFPILSRVRDGGTIKTATCAMVPGVVPDDTADLGDGVVTMGKVRHSITPMGAMMDVEIAA